MSFKPQAQTLFESIKVVQSDDTEKRLQEVETHLSLLEKDFYIIADRNACHVEILSTKYDRLIEEYERLKEQISVLEDQNKTLQEKYEKCDIFLEELYKLFGVTEKRLETIEKDGLIYRENISRRVKYVENRMEAFLIETKKISKNEYANTITLPFSPEFSIY